MMFNCKYKIGQQTHKTKMGKKHAFVGLLGAISLVVFVILGVFKYRTNIVTILQIWTKEWNHKWRKNYKNMK